jgi:hypothetical protein
MLLIVITGLSELLIAVASLKVILFASTLSLAFIGVLVAFIAESRNVKNTLNKIEQAILNSKKGINSKVEASSSKTYNNCINAANLVAAFVGSL